MNLTGWVVPLRLSKCKYNDNGKYLLKLIMDDRNSKLYTIVREAVHKQWDPIGIFSYSNDMGEYDGYIPKLCELLLNGALEDEIFEFLWIVETESMGLSGDKDATREFSMKLIELRG